MATTFAGRQGSFDRHRLQGRVFTSTQVQRMVIWLWGYLNGRQELFLAGPRGLQPPGLHPRCWGSSPLRSDHWVHDQVLPRKGAVFGRHESLIEPFAASPYPFGCCRWSKLGCHSRERDFHRRHMFLVYPIRPLGKDSQLGKRDPERNQWTANEI